MTQILHKNLNAGRFTAVVALDLQKAFDKVDKSIVLSKIAKLGINVAWFKSYILDRDQVVKIKDDFSVHKKTLLGVPQGSILGPLLFSIFINDLHTVIKHSTLILFADDNYLLISGFVNDVALVRHNLQNDLDAISNWMAENYMKLHATKTELLLVGTKYMLKKLDCFNVSVNGACITPKPFIQVLRNVDRFQFDMETAN